MVVSDAEAAAAAADNSELINNEIQAHFIALASDPYRQSRRYLNSKWQLSPQTQSQATFAP